MAMSAYLRDLRAKVGNELLLLPAVAVFVVDEQSGQVLLCRNAGQTHWEAIGGMVEPHEHPLTAAQRELHEETGLLVGLEDLVLLGTVGGPEYLVTYPNGHQVSYVTSVYRVTHRPTDTDLIVADGVEVTALGWHQLADLIGVIGSSSTAALDLSNADGAAPKPDPALFGLFVRSLLAEFGPLL
jgi:8-oxo-dGTP pyrophosphatase MutT (NUDIX family)